MRALKYPENSFTASPMNKQNMLPGNIGEGISNEADVNSKKKTLSINRPLIVDSLDGTCFSLEFIVENI